MKLKNYKVLDSSLKGKLDICICTYLYQTLNPPREFSKNRDDFLKWLEVIPKKSFVRLYTDKISLESEEFKPVLDLNKDRLEIVLYDFPEVKNEAGYHDGEFGRIMVYLPLSDPKFKLEYGLKYIWITPPNSFVNHFSMNNIKIMNTKKADVYYHSKGCFLRPWVPDEIEFPFANNRMIIRAILDFSRVKFLKFIKDTIKGKYSKIIDMSRKWNPDAEKKNELHQFFTVGYEEFYTNNFLYEEMKNYKLLIVYQLSLLVFRRLERRYNIILPNKEEMDGLEYKILTEGINLPEEFRDNTLLKENMVKYKILTDIAYDYLSEQDTTVFPSRMKKCYKDYEKYRDKINLDGSEFGVYLLVKP